LVSQAPQTGDEQLLGYFSIGLQSKICNQIRPHDPKELMRAMEIAQDVEDVSYEKKNGAVMGTGIALPMGVIKEGQE